MKRLWLPLALGLLVQAPLGCGDDKKDDAGDDEDDENTPVGPSTGAECDDSLTYAKDIKPIVEQYCTRCHSSKLTGAGARMNAPADHNFDSESGILEAAAHIDQQAGSGPRATNTTMPLTAPKPSTAERETLSQYLACHISE
jgi:uncharacterized membrane protein